MIYRVRWLCVPVADLLLVVCPAAQYLSFQLGQHHLGMTERDRGMEMEMMKEMEEILINICVVFLQLSGETPLCKHGRCVKVTTSNHQGAASLKGHKCSLGITSAQ